MTIFISHLFYPLLFGHRLHFQCYASFNVPWTISQTLKVPHYLVILTRMLRGSLSNIQPTQHKQDFLAPALAHLSTRYRWSLCILLWRHLDNSLKSCDPSNIVVTQLYKLLCPNSLRYCTLVSIFRANEDALVFIG